MIIRAIWGFGVLFFLANGNHEAFAITPIQSESTVPKFLTEEIIALLKPGTLKVADGDGFTELNYRLFEPITKSNRRYPLILFLNGHAKEQLDYHNIGQLKHLQSIIFREPTAPQRYQFFLLAVQCPTDTDGNWLQWQAASHEFSIVDPIEGSLRIVDKLLAEYPIDSGRISICGISTGANAAWELAVRYPKRFAAIVPLGSAGIENGRLERMKSVSTWAFHSSGDDPERVCASIDQLSEQGGDAYLTIIPKDEHACWDEAFRDYDTLTWMLAQRIGPEEDQDSDLFSTSIQWQAAKHYLLTTVGRREAWNATWPRILTLAGAAAIVLACRNQLRQTRIGGGNKTHELSSEVEQNDGMLESRPM